MKKRPRKNTEAKVGLPPTNASKGKSLLITKKKVKDWRCNKCRVSWNEEVKLGTGTKWIECESCKRWYHAKCISKKHCVQFGWNINESSDSEEEIKFMCAKCVHLGSDIDGDFCSLS